ncbi:MAG: hypothetical protein JO297_20775 [Nitrososphaeraceae archaeon]|nr:hypothetical protein [Nitrososphaeraceae archaeon]
MKEFSESVNQQLSQFETTHYESKDCFLPLILVILILIYGVGGVGQGKAIKNYTKNRKVDQVNQLASSSSIRSDIPCFSFSISS